MSIEFVKSVGELIGMELAITKTLTTRKGMAYQVETKNKSKMLLKAIDLKDTEEDTINRKRSLTKEADLLTEIEQFTEKFISVVVN